MRITENMRIDATSRALKNSAESLYGLTETAMSGKVIHRPSDGPAAYASIVGQNQTVARLNSRAETLSRSQGDLALAETTLASASDIFLRAREIAVEMADEGIVEVDARAAAAKEVAQLRQLLVGLANTKGTRGFLFSGTQTDSVPFDVNGLIAGNSNDEVMTTEIADGVTTAVNISGWDAFTDLTGGGDVFQNLADLETALNNNDQATVFSLIDQFDADQRQVVQARAEAGLLTERLRSAGEVTGNSLVAVMAARAEQEEGDPTEVYSQLANAQVAYERSLAVTRQVLAMASALQRF